MNEHSTFMLINMVFFPAISFIWPIAHTYLKEKISHYHCCIPGLTYTSSASSFSIMHSCSVTTLLLFFSLLTFFLKEPKTGGERCKSQLHPTAVLNHMHPWFLFYSQHIVKSLCSDVLVSTAHHQSHADRLGKSGGASLGIFLNEVWVQTPKSLAFLVPFCFWKQSPVTKHCPITKCEHKGLAARQSASTAGERLIWFQLLPALLPPLSQFTL